MKEKLVFSSNSVAFVVNNLDPNRDADYDAKFMVTLEKALAPQTFPSSDFVFIDQINPKDAQAKEKMKNARVKLLQLIASHHSAQQTEHENIDLESKEIKRIRADFKQKQDALLRDQDALMKKINQMKIELRNREEKANQQIEQLKIQLAEKDEERKIELQKRDEKNEKTNR